MQKRFFLSLAALLILGLLVQDAEARGGRRGGGGRFGNGNRANNGPNNNGANGARDGNFGANGIGANNFGDARQGNNFRNNIAGGGDRQFGQRLGNLAGQLQGAVNSGAINNLFKDVDSFGKDFAGTRPGELRTNFTAQNRPFTGDWYAAHPNAWRYSHPHADAWAVASIGTVGSWLGIAALNDGTVYTSETQDDAEDSDDSTEDADGDSDETTDETPAAGDFLPLGVFGIAAPGSQDASALVQLATNRQGELRGNYYDVLSGQEQPLTGTINKQTQLATFTVAGNTGTTFEASLVSLTQDAGTLTLRLAGGETRQVNLARLKDPATQSAE